MRKPFSSAAGSCAADRPASAPRSRGCRPESRPRRARGRGGPPTRRSRSGRRGHGRPRPRRSRRRGRRSPQPGADQLVVDRRRRRAASAAARARHRPRGRSGSGCPAPSRTAASASAMMRSSAARRALSPGTSLALRRRQPRTASRSWRPRSRRSVESLDRRHLVVGDDDARQVEQARLAGDSSTAGCRAAEEAVERHDLALAQRVDRRVGDLGEALPEVGVQRTRPVGEDGQRRVVAHRPGRFLRLAGHRLDDQPQILGGVAEGALQRDRRLDQRLAADWRAPIAVAVACRIAGTHASLAAFGSCDATARPSHSA